MPGLINQSMTGKQPANPQDVQRIVIAAVKVINTPQVSDQLLKMMKEAGDPAQALAVKRLVELFSAETRQPASGQQLCQAAKLLSDKGFAHPSILPSRARTAC